MGAGKENEPATSTGHVDISVIQSCVTNVPFKGFKYTSSLRWLPVRYEFENWHIDRSLIDKMSLISMTASAVLKYIYIYR